MCLKVFYSSFYVNFLFIFVFFSLSVRFGVIFKLIYVLAHCLWYELTILFSAFGLSNLHFFFMEENYFNQIKIFPLELYINIWNASNWGYYELALLSLLTAFIKFMVSFVLSLEVASTQVQDIYDCLPSFPMCLLLLSCITLESRTRNTLRQLNFISLISKHITAFLEKCFS